MSEGPSDPDLLDLGDIPTGTFRTTTPDPVHLEQLSEVVRGLGRWARRQAKWQSLVRGLLATSLLSIGGGIWWGASTLTELQAESRANREDIAEIRAAIERIDERQWAEGERWHRVDTTTRASGPEE